MKESRAAPYPSRCFIIVAFLSLGLCGVGRTQRKAVGVPDITVGIVQGTIKRVGTGEPIANVQVILTNAFAGTPSATLALFAALPSGTQLTPSLMDAVNTMPLDPVLTASSSLPTPTTVAAQRRIETALTDAAGRFAFSNLPPGQYVINAQKDGYATPSEGDSSGTTVLTTSPITVANEKSTPIVELHMVPAGTISGHLQGPNGVPLAEFEVGAYQYTYVDGGRAILTSRKSVVTDDRGEFRLFWLPAGEYAIVASPRPPTTSPNPQDRYLRTYFPGTTNHASAQMVAVKEGQQVQGVNIDVRSGNKVRVSGRLISLIPTAPEPPSAIFFLVPKDERQFLDASLDPLKNASMEKISGRFEIVGVVPGSYELFAMFSDGKGRFCLGRLMIDVGSQDLEGVTVTVRPGVSVKARIVNTNGSLPAALSTPLIHPKETFAVPIIASLTSGNGPISRAILAAVTGTRPVAPITSDGSGIALFPDVPEARYTFVVSNLFQNGYVSDIREGDGSIFDSGLLVGSTSPKEIQIFVNLADTTVSGTVLNQEKPVAFAKVVFVPEQARRRNAALYRWTNATSSGQFTLHNVPPGNYKIYSWANAPPNYAWENEEFMSKVEDLGQPVTVTNSSVADLQIQVIR